MQEHRALHQDPGEAAGVEELEHLLERRPRETAGCPDAVDVRLEVQVPQAGAHELEIEVEAVASAARAGVGSRVPVRQFLERLDGLSPERRDAEVHGAGVPAVYPRLAFQGRLRGLLEIIGHRTGERVEGEHAVPGSALEGVGGGEPAQRRVGQVQEPGLEVDDHIP